MGCSLVGGGGWEGGRSDDQAGDRVKIGFRRYQDAIFDRSAAAVALDGGRK